VFSYLVTSTARRKLLEALWRHGGSGTVAELAKRARTAYANAYRELHAMQRFGLATARIEAGREVFAANNDHPDATLMRSLVTSASYVPSFDRSAHLVRGRLRALGAPLLESPEPVEDREQALVEGVSLARHDPTVARVLPLAVWSQRETLDPEHLRDVARHEKVRHEMGFFLELTSELADDRAMQRLASTFRDHRVSGPIPFFLLPTTRAAEATAARRTPAVARRWGYVMDLDMDSIRSQFQKFTRDEAVRTD
jgi:hypothetical protein